MRNKRTAAFKHTIKHRYTLIGEPSILFCAGWTDHFYEQHSNDVESLLETMLNTLKMRKKSTENITVHKSAYGGNEHQADRE